MGYEALLFCPDEKLANVVRQVFTELEFAIELAPEPFAAVKKLMAQHYDVIVVDGENEQNAALLFKSARNSSLNQGSLAIALVEGQAGVAKAYRIGANLVLTKPINVEQAKGTLRVARGLLRKGSDASAAGAGTLGAPATAAKLVVGSSGVEPDRRGTRIVAPAPNRAQAGEFEAPWPGAGPRPGLDEFHAPTLGTRIVDVPAAQQPTKIVPENENRPQLASAVSPLKNDLIENDKTKAELGQGQGPSRNGGVGLVPAAGMAAAPAAAKAGPSPTKVNRIVEVETTSPAQATSFQSSPIQAGPAPAKPTQESSSPARRPADDAPASTFASVRTSDAPSFAGLGEDLPREGAANKKLLLAAIFILAIAVLGYLVFGKPGSSGTLTAPQPINTSREKGQLDSTPPTVGSLERGSSTVTTGMTASGTATPNMANSSTHDSVPKERTESPASNPVGGAANVSVIRIPAKAAASSSADSDLGAPKSHPLMVKSNAGRRAQSRTDEMAPQLPGQLEVAVPQGSSLTGSIISAPASLPRIVPANLKVSQGVSEGLLIKRVQPKYPPAAIAIHAEGAVQIQATINKEGYVTNPRVISGNSILAEAALDAVRQWRYKPYYLDGQPIEIQTQVTVNFRAK